MRLDVGPTSALTGFTPRLGGLAIAGRRHSEGNLQLDEAKGPTAAAARPRRHGQHRRLGSRSGGDRGRGLGAGRRLELDGTSELVVGGQLAVSGLRFDAAVGRDSAMLGEAGNRVTAGVGYDFGPLDTHMSYSLVETEQRTAETGLLTLGSSFALSSGIVVKGDLAIADEEDGEGTTAGRVSLRLNF